MPGFFTQRHVTVHDMPPEVLYRIFIMLAAMSSDEDIKRYYSLDWIAVTHVCKLWNQVARDNAKLWSSIDFSRPRWAKEMLGRSRSAPLYIQYNHDEMPQDGATGEEVMSQALKRLPLITEARIEGPVNVLKRFLSGMGGLPALALERIHMHALNSLERIEIQANFLNGFAPRLREVKLLGFSINLNTTLFRNVECLVLGPINSPIHITDMLLLLSNLPRIKSLTTAYTFYPPDEAEVECLAAEGPVLMPNITDMKVVTSWHDSYQDFASPTMFFRWLTFAQPLDVEIVLGWAHDEDTVLQYCGSVFNPVLPHFSTKATQFAVLDMAYSLGTENGCAEQHLYAQSANGASVLFTFLFIDEPFPETCRLLASQFATRIPRKDLKTVNLDGITLNAQLLCLLLGNLEHLEEISSFLHFALLDALHEVNGQDRCLFPSLTKMTLYYDGKYEETSDSTAWCALPDLLKFRAGKGSPIREIIMLPNRDSTVPKEFVDSLEGLVTIRGGE